jgi:lycopene beta-cyclase
MSHSGRPLRVAIIGAGLSGLCLALALKARKDFDGEVHLFEPRQQYFHDRHWALWRVSDHGYDHLPMLSFKHIEVRANKATHSVTCDSMPYCVLSSSVVYDFASTELENDLRFYLHMGTSVIDVAAKHENLQLSITSQASSSFDLVFDSRIAANASPKAFRQWFIGAELALTSTEKLPEPCLMDFCLGNEGPIGFFYVLPLDKTRVLVQLTYFLAPGEQPPENALAIWKHYVSNTLGLDAEAKLREENGCIPMQLEKTMHTAFGHHAIGTAAGWVRASTGYGFLDIQRAAQRMAEACCIQDSNQREQALRKVSARSRWDDRLDAIFLATLKREPRQAARFFSDIFRRQPSDPIIRFLGGSATWRDRLAVMLALPIMPFFKSLFLSFKA